MAINLITNGSMEMSIEPLVYCKLCLTEFPICDMYELKDCHCVYCRECVAEYIKVMIAEGDVFSLTCPDSHCKKVGKILSTEVEKFVDKEMYLKFTRIRFEKEVDMDPHRTFCPEVGCDTVCHVCTSSSVEVTSKPTSVICPTCGLHFCSICKSKWHDQQACLDIMASSDQYNIPLENMADARIKRCPLCRVPIERSDGCAQMMCKRCKHVFCWYCLSSLDDDFLLRHYDKGPCKNKLGHSRASVIWHRAQVVGIFAGFGVLLLVASPFLLLAAPCILCCKCKVCKCCDEADDIEDSGTVGL